MLSEQFILCMWWMIRFLNTSNCMPFQPFHDKTNKMNMRPAKTQISLGICPVWSESSLCAQWVAKGLIFLHADSEDSDQTRRMPRLIWVFAGRTVILLVLSWGGSFIKCDCILLPAQTDTFCDCNILTRNITVSILKIQTLETCCNYPKIWTVGFFHRVLCPKDTDRMANSVDPDQTAPSVCPDISFRKLRLITTKKSWKRWLFGTVHWNIFKELLFELKDSFAPNGENLQLQV